MFGKMILLLRRMAYWFYYNFRHFFSLDVILSFICWTYNDERKLHYDFESHHFCINSLIKIL